MQSPLTIGKDNQYTCDIFPASHFSHLILAWKKLELGKDMTYYQSCDWFKMLLKKNTNFFFRNKIYFGVVKNSKDDIVLIAPLFIKKGIIPIEYKKGIYFFGMGSFSDYSNFIYDDIEDDIFDVLFRSIIRKFNINSFYLEYLLENTALYTYIKENTCIEHDYVNSCVGLTLPNSIDEYHKILSKNSRQNIRTAYNRLMRDQINFTINFDDKNVNIEEFELYRNNRVKEKDRIQFSLSSIKKLIWRIIDNRRLQTKRYFPYKEMVNSKFLTVKDSDRNTLMSAVNYGYCKNRKEIVAMAVSLNDNYKRYSPGILGWYQFVLANIGGETLKYIDFTRGCENYKFVLGGKKHPSHFIKFKVK